MFFLYLRTSYPRVSEYPSATDFSVTRVSYFANILQDINSKI